MGYRFPVCAPSSYKVRLVARDPVVPNGVPVGAIGMRMFLHETFMGLPEELAMTSACPS